ncbi:hypothetical protein SERLA73DRAFT_69268 [Serpula lacrymans var. lacrymans S7.3]|uniref:Uncharacterized protein n=2 Tax=Serpula lacrymans var. lacrymans TaxID=341189 RepID=F8PIM4_SERL3|nr:hypothetical protein SERLA73DRAFT_69268 [Serpula lacrymans var. lacrymans S7.3]
MAPLFKSALKVFRSKPPTSVDKLVINGSINSMFVRFEPQGLEALFIDTMADAFKDMAAKEGVNIQMSLVQGDKETRGMFVHSKRPPGDLDAVAQPEVSDLCSNVQQLRRSCLFQSSLSKYSISSLDTWHGKDTMPMQEESGTDFVIDPPAKCMVPVAKPIVLSSKDYHGVEQNLVVVNSSQKPKATVEGVSVIKHHALQVLFEGKRGVEQSCGQFVVSPSQNSRSNVEESHAKSTMLPSVDHCGVEQSPTIVNSLKNPKITVEERAREIKKTLSCSPPKEGDIVSDDTCANLAAACLDWQEGDGDIEKLALAEIMKASPKRVDSPTSVPVTPSSQHSYEFNPAYSFSSDGYSTPSSTFSTPSNLSLCTPATTPSNSLYGRSRNKDDAASVERIQRRKGVYLTGRSIRGRPVGIINGCFQNRGIPINAVDDTDIMIGDDVFEIQDEVDEIRVSRRGIQEVAYKRSSYCSAINSLMTEAVSIASDDSVPRRNCIVDSIYIYGKECIFTSSSPSNPSLRTSSLSMTSISFELEPVASSTALSCGDLSSLVMFGESEDVRYFTDEFFDISLADGAAFQDHHLSYVGKDHTPASGKNLEHFRISHHSTEADTLCITSKKGRHMSRLATKAPSPSRSIFFRKLFPKTSAKFSSAESFALRHCNPNHVNLGAVRLAESLSLDFACAGLETSWSVSGSEFFCPIFARAPPSAFEAPQKFDAEAEKLRVAINSSPYILWQRFAKSVKTSWSCT